MGPVGTCSDNDWLMVLAGGGHLGLLLWGRGSHSVASKRMNNKHTVPARLAQAQDFRQWPLCTECGSFPVELPVLEGKVDTPQNGRGHVPTVHSTAQ